MKRLLYTCLLIVSCFGVAAEAAVAAKTQSPVLTRGNVKVIEATENIRFLSQEIAKSYLLLFAAPDHESLVDHLKKSLVDLNANLHAIATTTNDNDTRDILDFLAYSKDQIAEILNERPDAEKAALMLDYSETLLEGADSIASAHAYPFTKEEHMLIIAKKMSFLLERMMKYYIALHVGFDNTTNDEQMQKAIEKFNVHLATIETYRYPSAIDAVKKELEKGWKIDRHFLHDSKIIFLPELMLLSTGDLEEMIRKIRLYHNQNL